MFHSALRPPELRALRESAAFRDWLDGHGDDLLDAADLLGGSHWTWMLSRAAMR